VQITGFNQLHQARARLGDHLHIGGETVEQRGELGTLQSTGGGQHTDHATARGSSRRFDGGFHAHQRPIGIVLAQVGYGGDGRGIASDHERLGAPFAEKLSDPP